MTAESKRVKIACLVSLFLGIAEIVAGFVIPVPFGASVYLMFTPMVAGVLSFVLGVHGARAANVPSKAAGLRGFAAVITLISCVVLGAAVYFGHGFTIACGIVAASVVVDILVVAFSHQVKRALDRA